MARKFSIVLCLMLPYSFLSVASAIAQSASNSDESGGLQEVIVTAARREESSQKAALAVQAITPEELARAGVSRPEDLNALAPGVAIGTGANFPQVYIRGVGNFSTTLYAEGAVAMNMDGVYISRPWGVRGSFFDLDRVEVLKGPQGTLYGRNASGGAINLISARPTHDLGGYVDVSGGNYSSWSGEGAVNVPITSDLAIRASGQVIRHSGYLSDGYDDERSESARLHALWTPSTDLSLLLTGTYQHIGGTGEGAVLSPHLPGSPWRGAADPATAAIYGAIPGIGPLLPVPDRSGFLDIKVYSSSGELNWHTDAGTLTVIPAFRNSTYSALTWVPGFYTRNHDTDQQTSLETRFARESDWLRFVVGGYYFDEKESGYGGEPELVVKQGFSASANDRLPSQIRSYAGFGQGTVNVRPDLRLTGGLRYTYERKETDGSAVVFAFPNATPPPVCSGPGTFDPNTLEPPLYCAIYYPVQGTLTYNSVTYKGGMEYDLGPQSLLYGNVSTGFKSGGFFFAPAPNTFKPEKLTAYELGSKNRFFDNRLQLNAEAFYWKYRDHQESHVGPTSIAGLFTFITENAGRATLYGLDIDGTWLVTKDDRLDVKAEYEHSRYDSFSYSNDTARFGPPVTGCAVGPIVSGVQNVDCAGKQLARAPTWSGTVGYDHTVRLGGAGQLTASVDTQYASSAYMSIDFLPANRQDTYAVVNLNLRYLEPGGKWSVNGYVRNVGDTAVYTQGFRWNGVNWMTIRPPRTFGGQFRYDF